MNLEGTYDVTHNGMRVGTVSLTRQGLYYAIACRCHAAGDQMLRLWVEAGGNIQDLGLLIPAAGALELKRQMPCKRMGEGMPVFSLRGRAEETAQFLPVEADVPFPWLRWLDTCVFAVRKGRAGVERQPENNDEKVEI